MYLNVSGLEVRYGGAIALSNLNIDVHGGQCVMIVGPNGAGKTTLMHAIMGLVQPTTGTILFDDSSLIGLTPERIVRRGLSLVPEGRHIFGSLSVSENLMLGTTVRGDKAELSDDLDFVMSLFPILRERWKGSAGHLSGGEQQQLAIARALLQRPKLLMIDEPSLGLAPRVIDSVYDCLQMLRQRGISLLIVEQSTVRVLDLADRVCVLRSGRMVFNELTENVSGYRGVNDAYFGYEGKADELQEKGARKTT